IQIRRLEWRRRLPWRISERFWQISAGFSLTRASSIESLPTRLGFWRIRKKSLLRAGARSQSATDRLRIQGVERSPIRRLVCSDSFAHCRLRDGTVLETALGKHRHVKAGDRLHAAPYDLTFQFVE